MKTFPMFLQMAGRRVMIIGGGEQAAQKTRLILKTEAEIVVLSPALNAELQRYADANKIIHRDEPLTAALLQSAILVFSATGCAGAGGAHGAFANETNTLINVVDMPELCDAMTPSIVDRDPLVVAIGTEGCAPILGRQIKSKIETALEPRLGDLVAFAGRMRAEVIQNIAQNKRREFWSWVFNGAPRREFKQGNERRSFAIIKDMIYRRGEQDVDSGQVSFIQSSQGAIEQLRLVDVAKLQEADLIFFAQDLHEDILELARRDAERIGYEDTPQMLSRVKTMNSDPRFKGQNVTIISPINVSNEVHVYQ